MNKIRVKCISDRWRSDCGKDPDLTKGRFYQVQNENILVMGYENMVEIIGNNGIAISRPKHIFEFFRG